VTDSHRLRLGSDAGPHEPESSVRLRPALVADLVRVRQIWAANQDDPARASPLVPSLYLHELDTRELVVAEHAGRVVGFAALITRGQVRFLADLFVDPVYQSAGLGNRLLRHVLPRDGSPCCTLSSSDPQALSLYIRAGLRPYWPCFQLRGGAAFVAESLPDEPEVVEARVGDPELIEWDKRIGGRPRPQDHAYWVERRDGVPLWFVRHGQRVAYGYAQRNSDDLPDAPETLTIGPIGARTPADAVACVVAAVRWGAGQAPEVRISVPGPHPALALLLEFGLRIRDVDTFCSTHVPRFADVRRYLPPGGDLY
jgi:GNAT superfamily N-acetyltransferase